MGWWCAAKRIQFWLKYQSMSDDPGILCWRPSHHASERSRSQMRNNAASGRDPSREHKRMIVHASFMFSNVLARPQNEAMWQFWKAIHNLGSTTTTIPLRHAEKSGRSHKGARGPWGEAPLRSRHHLGLLGFFFFWLILNSSLKCKTRCEPFEWEESFGEGYPVWPSMLSSRSLKLEGSLP